MRFSVCSWSSLVCFSKIRRRRGSYFLLIARVSQRISRKRFFSHSKIGISDVRRWRYFRRHRGTKQIQNISRFENWTWRSLSRYSASFKTCFDWESLALLLDSKVLIMSCFYCWRAMIDGCEDKKFEIKRLHHSSECRFA